MPRWSSCCLQWRPSLRRRRHPLVDLALHLFQLARQLAMRLRQRGFLLPRQLTPQCRSLLPRPLRRTVPQVRLCSQACQPHQRRCEAVPRCCRKSLYSRHPARVREPRMRLRCSSRALVERWAGRSLKRRMLAHACGAGAATNRRNQRCRVLRQQLRADAERCRRVLQRGCSRQCLQMPTRPFASLTKQAATADVALLLVAKGEG